MEAKVAIPSGRGIRSGEVWRGDCEYVYRVAIPSGRGIRSGKCHTQFRVDCFPSQSPLVGAFVPAYKDWATSSHGRKVAIPSGRGIRSGHAYKRRGTDQPAGRNPLWSGHSFRPVLSFTKPVYMYMVAIPSGRGIRSGPSKVRELRPHRRVAIPSGRGIRSGQKHPWPGRNTGSESQSPLVGAFVPAFCFGVICGSFDLSQSPLVGAFVPAYLKKLVDNLSDRSQSPLVGAFVPA